MTEQGLALEVRGVSKRFGDVEVLNGVSLAVKDGEFVSLVGPSGSGKSTLFRLIGGLERADEGDIRVGGGGNPAGLYGGYDAMAQMRPSCGSSMTTLPRWACVFSMVWASAASV